MAKIAVLDLGTNTFHLLIASGRRGDIEILFKERNFVKLAGDGIDRLSDAAMHRGMLALEHFMQIIVQYKVDVVKAVGTAALRTASNGPLFLSQIKESLNLEVEIIDGNMEAKLIYDGVKQVWQPSRFPALIMDIGGGSVEFIMADQTGILWAESFPVGVSVLFNNFHDQDPISQHEIEKLDAFLDDRLSTLVEMIRTHQPALLIGASGTFDVIGDILGYGSHNYQEAIVSKEITPILDKIALSTIEERIDHEKIPDTRVDMIVVAVLLLRHTLQLGNFTHMGICAYALKEGLILDFLD